MKELYLTPVVKNLLVMNIIMFIASIVMPQATQILALYPTMSVHFRPFQFVTHFFMHANFFHIIFNMYALINLGVLMETFWREQRFLFYYLFCAIGSAILHSVFNYYQYQQLLETTGYPEELVREMIPPAVGASGAIYGLFIACFYYFPEKEITFFMIPIPTQIRIAVPVMVGIEIFSGFYHLSGDRIAHFAHLGGALFGFILLYLWKKNYV
jgi:membrane associated rhomboid family serine protease